MSIAQALAQHATQPETEFNTFKFDLVGTAIAGTIQAVKWDFKTQFDDKANIISILDEADGQVKDVWVSTVQLINGLKLKPMAVGGQPLGRPVQAGDQVYIRLDNIQQLEGGKSLKHYSIAIQPGNLAAQAQPVTQAQPQQQGYQSVPQGQVYTQQVPPAQQPAQQVQPGYGAPQPAYGQPAAQQPAQAQQPGDGDIPF